MTETKEQQLYSGSTPPHRKPKCMAQDKIHRNGKKLHSMAFPLSSPLLRRVPRKIADTMYIEPLNGQKKKRATCRAECRMSVVSLDYCLDCHLFSGLAKKAKDYKKRKTKWWTTHTHTHIYKKKVSDTKSIQALFSSNCVCSFVPTKN